MEDLVWKKKSTEVYKYFMLFFIRLAEVLTSSIIPSIIGIVIVFITPEPRVMQTMETISFIIFTMMSCIFWVRYVKHRPNIAEFYIMNGIVYLLYLAISVVLYLLSDAYMYSIMFSNLRGFEIFGVRTLESLIIVHSIMIIAMMISERIAHIFYKRRAMKAVENGADKVEMEFESKIPQKANEEVAFLTVDEVNIEYEREIQEAADLIKQTSVEDNDKNWDKNMVQGSSGTVQESTPHDPDNDIEDSDYFSEAYAREEMKDTENYTVDALWNEEIYKGQGKIEDYDEEEYYPELFEDDDEFWGDDESIIIGEIEDDYEDDSIEDMPNSFLEYDTDNLWGDIKQGK